MRWLSGMLVALAAAGLPLAATAQALAAADPRLETLASLINAERARQGLPPVAPHPELDKLAAEWARTLASEGKSHHRSNLRLLMNTNGWLGLNENLHMTTLPLDPSDVIGVWLASPPHRRNLLDPDATHLGVGTAPDAQGRNYTVFNAAHIPPPGPPQPQPAMAGLLAPPGAAKPSPFPKR